MKKMKRIFLITVASVLLFGMTLGMTKDTQAAQKAPRFQKTSISTFLVKPKHSFIYSLKIKNLDSKAKVKKVKSNNKKVLTVEYEPGTNYIKYTPKKEGTAVISCVVKQNGKTYKLKKTIKVLKADPFKSITVNGKQVYQKRSNVIYYYSMAKKAEVSFQLKDGWTLKRMYYNYHDKKMSKNYKMKNGEKITIKGKGNGKHTSVKIDVKNKKGEVFRFLICLYQNEKGMDYFLAPSVEQSVLFEGNQ